MAVLASDQIHDLMYRQDLNERLVVTPLLDAERQVQKAAVDLRLGSEFVVLHHGRTGGLLLDVFHEDADRIQHEIERTVDKTYVPLGSSFVLHPGQLVLTASLEYVSIPQLYTATVVGRSSWGRLGLNIATATMVAPGFKGCITFEMVNLGSVPLGVYPGARIAQLVVHTLDHPEPLPYGSAGSKYICPIGPEFSKISEDADWKLIERFRAPRDEQDAICLDEQIDDS